MSSLAFFRQRINTYLALALVALMGFWTCLYYFTHKAEAIGTSYADSTNVDAYLTQMQNRANLKAAEEAKESAQK
jgi:hypothetical protein